MLFNEVDIIMDYTDSKDYICYSIFKLTEFQVDFKFMGFTFIFCINIFERF